MGFEQTLNAIIRRLPKQRRTGLFSATMSDAVSELSRAGLRNPVRISVKVQDKLKQEIKTPSSLSIHYLLSPGDEKLSNLIAFLLSKPDQKFIIYFCTCACVDYFYRVLTTLPHLKKFNTFCLHGKMDQKKRTSTVMLSF